ncbi:MAG: effector-associated domain EAD1-containing protein, partial [Chloroflexota bacterium]|nr:effector-associated domain EAD1-containing protein [Chloroflexota bacterium]
PRPSISPLASPDGKQMWIARRDGYTRDTPIPVGTMQAYQVDGMTGNVQVKHWTVTDPDCRVVVDNRPSAGGNQAANTSPAIRFTHEGDYQISAEAEMHGPAGLETATVQLTQRVMDPERPLKDAFGNAAPTDYTQFRAGMAFQGLELSAGAEANKQAGAAPITSSGANPATLDSPHPLLHTYTVQPAKAAAHFHWYVQVKEGASLPPTAYRDFACIEKDGQPAFDLRSDSPTVLWPLAQPATYLLICEQSDAGGQIVATSRYIQGVITPAAAKQYTDWQEYVVTADAKMAGNIPEGLEVGARAVYMNSKTGATTPLALFLGHSRRGSNGKADNGAPVRLLDLTPDSPRMEYGGGTTDEAIADFAAGNKYLVGLIRLEIPPNDNLVAPVQTTLTTKGTSDLGAFAGGAGWASLGLVGLGIAASLTGVGLVAAPFLFAAAAAAGAASSGADLVDQLRQTKIDGRAVALDVLGVATSLLGLAGARLAASGVRAGETVTRGGRAFRIITGLQLAGDVGSGILICDDGLDQIMQILSADNPQPRSAKIAAVAQVLANLALNGGLILYGHKKPAGSELPHGKPAADGTTRPAGMERTAPAHSAPALDPAHGTADLVAPHSSGAGSTVHPADPHTAPSGPSESDAVRAEAQAARRAALAPVAVPSHLPQGASRELPYLLLEAYPTRRELDALSQQVLGESLAQAAGGTTLTDSAFNLVEHAAARDRDGDLLTAALQANPHDGNLHALARGDISAHNHEAFHIDHHLEGSQYKALHDALVAAFPTESSLAQMVRRELGENLEEITKPGSLEDQVFTLIGWAEQYSKTGALVAGARTSNPGNPQLGRVAGELGIVVEIANPARYKAAPLDESQQSALARALVGGFPNTASLERIIRKELGENLAARAGAGSLNDVTARLVGWAVSNGRQGDLLALLPEPRRTAILHVVGQPARKGAAAEYTAAALANLSPQRQALYAALLAAFDQDSLEQMVRTSLNKELASFTHGPLDQQVFELIGWADSHGKIVDLVLGARRSNGGNAQLVQAANDMGLNIKTAVRTQQPLLVSLNGWQEGVLSDELAIRFPTTAALARVVQQELGESLTKIIGNGSIADVSWSLVQWAAKKGRTGDLLALLSEGRRNAVLHAARPADIGVTAAHAAPSLTHLSREQRQALSVALIVAYPSKNVLAQMVRRRLDQNLGEIVKGRSLTDQVFNLIEWAESYGKIEVLIKSVPNF